LSNSSVEGTRARSWRRVSRDGSITLTIHVQPGAKRSEIAGLYGDAVKIRLAAPAVDGTANAALIALLADAFGVPEREVTLVRGVTSRRKTVRIAVPGSRPDRTWGD